MSTCVCYLAGAVVDTGVPSPGGCSAGWDSPASATLGASELLPEVKQYSLTQVKSANN